MRIGLALVVVLIGACSGSTPPPSATPSVALASTSLAPSAPASPSSFFGPVTTRGLGALRGDWVFWIQEEAERGNVSIRVDLLAMPLAGGTPTVAVSYRKSAGGITLEPQNVIGRQLGPDGRRIVLHTSSGLVLVDLETGAQRSLATGVLPVWRSGDTIAYYKVISEATYGGGDIYVVDVSGRERAVAAQGAPLAWAGETSSLAIGRLEPNGRLQLVVYGFFLGQSFQPSVAFKGFISPGGDNVAPLTTKPGVPNLIAAVALTNERGDDGHIDVISLIGATTQDAIVSASGSFVNVRFEEPRWSPAADQILYRRAGAGPPEVHIFDLTSRRDQPAIVVGVPTKAEWTPDGEQLVYLSADPPGGQAVSLRAIRPISGRDDRELAHSPSASVRMTDVATFRYAP